MHPDLHDYFTNNVAESWCRCYPVWQAAGRVEDKPHGVRYPRYTPSLGKRLGQEFADRFRDDWLFLVPKLTDGDPVVRVCAFDLLEQIACEFDCDVGGLPDAIREINAAIPEPALSDIRSEWHFEDFTGTTVGVPALPHRARLKPTSSSSLPPRMRPSAAH